MQVLPVVSTVPSCTSRAIQTSGRALMLTTVSVTAIVYLPSVIFVVLSIESFNIRVSYEDLLLQYLRSLVLFWLDNVTSMQLTMCSLELKVKSIYKGQLK